MSKPSSEQRARTNVDAAHAAIGAAIRSASPTMNVGELVSCIIALIVTQPGYTPEAADVLVRRIMFDLVRLVGERRAHELVNEVGRVGAGHAFS